MNITLGAFHYQLSTNWKIDTRKWSIQRKVEPIRTSDALLEVDVVSWI